MKLSHRDFRPQKRSKFVSQPPPHKPILRILLLAVFGAIVYLKFDSFISLNFIQKILHRTKGSISANQNQTVAAIAGEWIWSKDSLNLDFTCANFPLETCLAEKGKIDFAAEPSQTNRENTESQIKSRLRSLLKKMEIQWKEKPKNNLKVQLVGSRDITDSPIDWKFSAISFQGIKDKVNIIISQEQGKEKFCLGSYCLDEEKFQSPLEKYSLIQDLEEHTDSNRNPISHFTLDQSQEIPVHQIIHPISKGMIISFQSKPLLIKLYHGHGLFSYYSGNFLPKKGLQIKTMVNLQDTLGHLEKSIPISSSDTSGSSTNSATLPDSSRNFTSSLLGNLSLQVERNGQFINPTEFLNLQIQMEEKGSHAP